MLSYDPKTFNLIIYVTDKQKVEALNDFRKMIDKISKMFKYVEDINTPHEEREKYSNLSINFMRSISRAVAFLLDIGITKEEIEKYYKF